ncbi:MAG: GntR family transcriptional regulator [Pseudonocardiales bacterium]|nr:GntR family transcriptional regulator [Pseudonocardiales bacterium]
MNAGVQYQAIAEQVEARIRAGEWGAGATLPRQVDLMSEYAVSRETIRAAVALLEERGLVRSIKGRGAVVRDTAPRRQIPRSNLVTRDPARGYIFPAASHPGEPWIAHGRPRRDVLAIPAGIATHLGLAPGMAVLRRRRVTSPTGEPPFQLVDTWIHPDAVAEAPQVAEPNTGPGGYLDRLEEAGHGPLTWTEIARVRMPSRDEAKLLNISTAVPVLELTRIGVSARTGAAIEATVCVIPGDRVELLTVLHRDHSATWPTTPPTPGIYDSGQSPPTRAPESDTGQRATRRESP